MNILLVGHVCIDENVSEKVTYKSWGSALMYMYRHFLKYQDCRVSLLAPYGQDFHVYLEGAEMLNSPEGEHTLIYKNEIKNGVRKQSVENVEYAEPVTLSRGIEDAVAKADIIVLASLLPSYSPDYVTNLLKQKSPECLTVLLPQGYLRKVGKNSAISYREFSESSKIIPLFDMVIVSNEDIPSGEKTLRHWAKESPNTNIIMTERELGASIITEFETIHISTKPIAKEEIVDSIGSGDTFSAATIYEYKKSSDLKSAIATGNKAAGDKLRTSTPL